MILTTVAVAICLGIGAQVLAERLKLPAILPLLLLGLAAGPSALSWFDPEALGEGLEVLIHLGVAVILFEGGLSLEPRWLRQVGGAVWNLLTLGVLVTGAGAAWLGHAMVGMAWPAALLLGVIVTVTGPTVIAPLLRHTIAPRKVKTVLLSEGLIIDPVGAILAYLVLQWIELAGVPVQTIARELVVLVGTGTVLGFVAGSLAKIVARQTRLFDRELRNLAILALLMLCYLVAENQAPTSGILASVVMGFTLSASEVPDLVSLKAFKGQLTTLLISLLFVLLAGQLDLAAVVNLGWRGLVVAAALILIVRPLAVLVSLWPAHFGWRDRAFLALTAPRGIVAAAVASLAARQLQAAGEPAAALLEGLIYLVIVATGLWATLMSLVLPPLLGYTGDPSRRRTVLVGASPLARALAQVLKPSAATTVVIDTSLWRLESFRQADFLTVRGDARDAATYEQAGVEPDTTVLGVSTNDELNLLVAELVQKEFGVKNPVVALQHPPEEMGKRSRAWVELLAGRALAVPYWNQKLADGQVVPFELKPEGEKAVRQLRDLVEEHPKEILLLGGWQGETFDFRVDLEKLESWDRVTLLVTEGEGLSAVQGLSAHPSPPTVVEQ